VEKPLLHAAALLNPRAARLALAVRTAKDSSMRRTALLFAALPLALALAACKKEADATGAPTGAPVAKVTAPAGKTWAETVSLTPDGGYLMGNPNAPIKLIEYGALSCSHCAEFSEAGSVELRDAFVNSGRVSYELRYFMLNAIDVPAALLATCGPIEAVIPVSDQFWAWQKDMFTALQANTALYESAASMQPAQRFATIAKAGGMDTFFAARGIAADQANKCLANVEKAGQLMAATEKAGRDLGVSGTPTFFLNGVKLDGNTWPVVKGALEKAGAR
jgi:protein-disulfide isomerase